MDNLLSYCGLVDARISTAEKDLPVLSLLTYGGCVRKCPKMCQRNIGMVPNVAACLHHRHIKVLTDLPWNNLFFTMIEQLS